MQAQPVDLHGTDRVDRRIYVRTGHRRDCTTSPLPCTETPKPLASSLSAMANAYFEPTLQIGPLQPYVGAGAAQEAPYVAGSVGFASIRD